MNDFLFYVLMGVFIAARDANGWCIFWVVFGIFFLVRDWRKKQSKSCNRRKSK
jgi:hypothetical protein